MSSRLEQFTNRQLAQALRSLTAPFLLRSGRSLRPVLRLEEMI